MMKHIFGALDSALERRYLLTDYQLFFHNIQILELTRFVEEPVLNLEQIFISFTFAALIQWLPTKLMRIELSNCEWPFL